MAEKDDIGHRRLITKVAWLYHNRQMRQTEIAARLGISQSRVSRMLELASSVGIVKTIVVVPEGLHAELEEELERRYGLREAHVFDVSYGAEADEHDLINGLGQLVAARLHANPLDADIIGFTSWSRSLRATVAALTPLRSSAQYVVEMLGDVGPVTVQHEAAHATQQLATLVGAAPVFLRIPGVVANKQVKHTLLDHDMNARRALELLDQMQLALEGIGTCEIVSPLAAGENFFTNEQFRHAQDLGAVGQVNLRFITEDGTPVHSELDDLVVGVTLEQLHRSDRTLAVAGGPSKYRAIRAALLGGWVNALVTDLATAEHLIENR